MSASNFKGKGAMSEIGGSKIAKILTSFPEINPEWLLTGQGKMIKEQSMISDEISSFINTQLGTYNVFDFVSLKAAEEAMPLMRQNSYFEKPNMYIPDLGPGTHMRTLVKGNHMYSTIKDGDRVISTLVTDIKTVHNGYVYVILDRVEGLHYKRVFWKDSDTLEFTSDNEEYATYTRDLNEILVLFKIREIHSRDLHPQFNDLQKDIRTLFTKVSKLEAKLL